MADEKQPREIRTAKLFWFFCALPFAAALWLLFLCTNALSFFLRFTRGKGKLKSPVQPGAQPLVSVVIPNYNGKELLEQSLPPLIQALEAHPHEIIVVDNDSSDGSTAFMEEKFPDVKIERLGRNLGFGGACNHGAKKARGNILIFLNNDMAVEKNFLKPLLEPFEDPAVFAVTSQIYLWDRGQDRVETGKTKIEFAQGALWVSHEQEEADRNSAVFYAGGGSSAFDRRKFRKLGGFDSIYHPFYGEDTDLSYQAWKRGWKVLYAPGSIVFHKHRGTVNRYFSPEEIDLAMRKNLLLLLWKNMTDSKLLLFHCLFLPLHLAAHRAYILPEKRISPRVLFKALKQLPVVLIRRLKTGARKRLMDRELFKAMSHPVLTEELHGPGTAPARKNRLNILMVSPYSVYPTKHGGAVRMYNIIKYLSEIHNIFLLGYVDTPDQLEGVRELEKYCKLVKFTVRSSDYDNRDPSLLYPPVAYHFISENMKKEILDCVAACRIDLIQLEYTQLAFLDIKMKTIPTILVEHDISFRSLWRKKRQGMQSILLEERESFGFSNWLKLVHKELRYCREADQVHTMSEIDQRYLQNMLPRQADKIIAVPNGVDTAYYEKNRTPPPEPHLLFVGNFRHTPNIEGILFFLEKIWPLMKQRIQDVKLFVIGQKPPDALRDIEKSEPIIVTDFVEDLRPYYKTCSVFIAPIRAGSGTRLKILEAMAAGIPVVSTTVGAEGIDCTDGRHIFLADTPESFTAKTYELMTNTDKREKIVSNARKLVEDRYDWRIIVKKLDASYRLALEKKSTEGRRD